MQNRASINAENNGKATPLHFAAKHNHIDIVKALLKYGAVYDAHDNQGRSPVQLKNSQEIIELLNIIDKLFNCVRESNLNELISYLNKGAVVNACNSDEKTLLQLAVEQNHLELASILLERCANVNDLDEDQ